MKHQKIINSIRRLKKKEFWKEAPIQPIVNFQSYYNDKLRTEGCESVRLRKLKEYHDSLPENMPTNLKKEYTYPYDFEHVGVVCKVTKSGNVKVSILLPFLEQYNNYHSKGLNPPMKEKVQLMSAAGYPEHILMKIICRTPT